MTAPSLPARARRAAHARGLAIFVGVYAVGSWMALASYDWSAFPLSYQLERLALNSHAVLLLLAVCAAELARLYADFVIREWTADPHARAAAHAARRARERGLVVVCALAVGLTGVALTQLTPYELGDGRPGLVPNASFEMDRLSRRPSILVQTNAQGFRDEPWEEREEDVYRVVVVGDSLVFGSGITAQEDTLRYVLAAQLHSEAEVFTVALNGLNFDQEVELLEAHAPALRPDLIVVIHNLENDLMPVLPYYEGLTRMVIFPMSFIAFVEAVDRYQVSRELWELPGRLEALQASTDRLATLAGRHDADVLFVYVRDDCPIPYFRPPRGPAGRFAYTSLGRWAPALTFEDDFHPNPAGVRWMADRLAPLILRMRSEPAPLAGRDPLTREFESHCEPTPPPRPAARPAPELDDAPPVLPPEAQARLLGGLAPYGLGDAVSGGWTVSGLDVRARSALVRLRRGSEEARLELRHRSRAGGASWTSTELSITLAPNPLPDGAARPLAMLAERLIENDPRGLWVIPRARP